MSRLLTTIAQRNTGAVIPALSSASFALQNTTTTNGMGADGYDWSQGGVASPLCVDQYGKLVAIAEDSSNVHAFVYSNNSGASWSEALSISFLERGAIAYNSIDDVFCVLWNGAASTDGILFREYTPTRDGSHNITGFSAVGGGYTQFDAQGAGTMAYSHPCILYLSDIGTHGTLLCAWCCRNTGVGGTGNEIRAAMRTLTGDANDLTVSNWVHIGVNSTSTIGNAPLTGSYTAFVANTTASIPYASLARLANKDLFLAYSDGATTNLWRYRRDTWNGTNWPTLGTITTISNIKRAGTDSGYIHKEQLVSKIVQDTAGNAYVGIATWKDDTSGDTWGYAQITSGDVVTLVDDYSANGAHSYAPTGDIDYDTAANRIIDAYIATSTQAVSTHLFNGTASAAAATQVFNSAPVDIPLLHTRAVSGKLCLLFRDTNSPKKGWFGTLNWNV